MAKKYKMFKFSSNEEIHIKTTIRYTRYLKTTYLIINIQNRYI